MIKINEKFIFKTIALNICQLQLLRIKWNTMKERNKC